MEVFLLNILSRYWKDAAPKIPPNGMSPISTPCAYLGKVILYSVMSMPIGIVDSCVSP